MSYITDPLYLPLKRGGLVCLPLECPMISNEQDGKIRENLESVGDIIIHPWERNNHPCGRLIICVKHYHKNIFI